MDMIEEGKVRRRRRYDDKFKQQVVVECTEPGLSYFSGKMVRFAAKSSIKSRG
jgi:transposase-like protein